MIELKQQAEVNTAIEILRVIGVDLLSSDEKLKMRLRYTNGVLQAEVNPYAGKIYIEYDPTRVSREELRTIVAVTTSQHYDKVIHV